jgi:hypothetical protein
LRGIFNMQRKFIIFSGTIVAVFLAAYFLFLGAGEKTSSQNTTAGQDASLQLSPQEVMEIMKTDKDYNDYSNLTKDFNPEIAGYMKLGPQDYEKIKAEWKEQGFGDRISAIDKINLTDSTYWVELKNINDEKKGFRVLVDTKEKKSLFTAAFVFVEMGASL